MVEIKENGIVENGIVENGIVEKRDVLEKKDVLEKIDELLKGKLDEEKREQLRNLKRRSNRFTGLSLLKQASGIMGKDILE